jgi:hypothetical protein
MNSKLTVISYTLAALSGICFIQGLATLTQERGLDHGQSKEIHHNVGSHTER